MRECSPPQTCHMSHVTCHMSCVTSHMSRVTCHLSHVIFFFYILIFFYVKKNGQSGGASRWRVCYQRGLPHLVYIVKGRKSILFFSRRFLNIISLLKCHHMTNIAALHFTVLSWPWVLNWSFSVIFPAAIQWSYIYEYYFMVGRIEMETL